MVLNFERNIANSLEQIKLKKYQEIIISEKEETRTWQNSDDLVSKYGEAKWEIIDLLNQHYGFNFNLYNWLKKNQKDEVAYFLCEAGSNSLNYSEFKIPAKFHLWLGEQGFVIGIEQKGEGFPAQQVNFEKRKKNNGAAFNFFRDCRSEIFFDDPKKAKTVFLRYSLIKKNSTRNT